MSIAPIPPDYLASAHALIKALKASVDPPAPNWPVKLVIANQALSTDLYLPNKHQIIRDWIIDTWSRSRPESLLEPEFHDLLLRLPIEPVDISSLLVSYLRQATKSAAAPHAKAGVTFRALSRSSMIKPEAWSEAWSAMLAYLNQDNALSSDWYDFWTLICRVWRPENSLENRKKISSLILPSLPLLARARRAHTEIQVDDPVVFGTMMPTLETFAQIFTYLGQPNDSILHIIPSLVEFYVSFVTKERYRLFAQPSSSKISFDVFLADKIRQTILHALSLTLEYLQGGGWETRAAVWKHIVDWGGYLETDQAWRSLVQREAQLAASVLPSQESSRPSALTVLAHLETLDHEATNIGSEVIGWCIASPSTLLTESEALLAALGKYHRLTRTLPELIELLDDSCLSLLSTCGSFKPMRAVYDLIVSGAMFGGSMREAFHVSGKISEGLSATLLEKVTQRAEPTESKRQKLDSTSYLEAAMTGIRSRLISTLLFDSAELPTVTINHCVEHLRPHTIASDSKSRSAWAADVNLAAMLRLMELDTASTGIPDLDPGRELLDETRLQLVMYALTRTTKEDFASVLESSVDRLLASHLNESLWHLVSNHRLLSVLESRISPEHRSKLVVEIASSGQARHIFSAELLENPLIRASIDDSVGMLLGSDGPFGPGLAYLLPLASKDIQETAIRQQYLKQTAPPPALVMWTTQMFKTGQLLPLLSDSTLLNHMVRNLSRQECNGTDLLRCIFSITVRQTSKASISAITDALKGGDSSSQWLSAATVFFDSLKAARFSLDDATRGDIVQMVQEVSSLLRRKENTRSRLQYISAWRAIQSLNSSLGLEDSHAVVESLIGELASSSHWSRAELVELVRLVRLEAGSSAAPVVLKALSVVDTVDGLFLRELLEGAQAAEMEALLTTAITGLCRRPAWSIALLAAVIEVGREDINAVVRQHLSELLDVLVTRVEGYSQEISHDVMALLRRLIDRQPFALASRDIATLLDILVRIVSSQGQIGEPVNTIIALLRHRRETLIQHAALLVDVLRTILFAFKRADCRVAEAALMNRLLHNIANDRSKSGSAFHQAIVKHLPSLLVAFARIVATSRISTEVRRELKNGLFSICDLVTAGGRVSSRGREGEALGDSFGLGEGNGGEAERDVWADLWKEWAGKRYTGQG